VAAELTHAGAARPATRDADHDLTRTLVRIRLRLWRAALTGRVMDVVGMVFGIIGAVWVLGAVVAAVVGSVVLQQDLSGLVLVLLGSAVVLGWWVVPLFAFGIEDSMPANRFALLPVPVRRLHPGLAVAGLLTMPAITSAAVALVLAVGVGIEAVRHGAGPGWSLAAVVLGVLGAVATFLLAVLLPRAVAAAQHVGGGRSRRARELGGILTFVILMTGFFLLYGWFIGQGVGDGIRVDREAVQDALETAVAVLGWTVGAGIGAPLALAQGDVLGALLRLVVLAVPFPLLWAWWRRSVATALVSAGEGSGQSADVADRAFVPRFLPRTPVGAVAARSLRYWRRDTRYLGGGLVTPLLLVFFVVMGLVNEEMRFLGYIGVLIACGMSGTVLGNDLGLDGRAGWVHLVSGIRGRDDLAGRAIASILLNTPLLVVGAVVVCLVGGRPDLLSPLVLGGLGLVLASHGTVLLVAILLPYRAQEPGGNPFKNTSGNSVNAFVGSLVMMLGVWVPQLPALALGIAGLVAEIPLLVQLSGPVALLLGIVTLVVLLRVGGALLDRRRPEVFAVVREWAV
jgi:ABC-2 type transport system permease protein